MQIAAFVRHASSVVTGAAGVVCTLLLTGCDKPEVRVYRVPKEASTTPPKAPAHGHGHMAAMPKITWKAPAGWEEQDGGGMRVVRFAVRAKEGPAADVGVMPLPAGAMKQSDLLNMIRNQVELPPVTEGELDKQGEKVSVGPRQGALFEMVSAKPLIEDKFKVRILMASVTNSDTLWLFKIAGPDDLVGEQRAPFIEFLKSIHFDTAGVASASAPPVPPPPSAAPATTAPSAGRPQWSVPAGWQEQPPGSMVVARFALGGAEGKAEVTVSVFPGDTGGLLANVNRWRGQMSLEPITEAALPTLIESFDVGGGKATLVEMTGTDRKTSQSARLIGAIVPRGGQTWFFKLVGDAQAAGREKAALLKFIQTAELPHA